MSAYVFFSAAESAPPPSGWTVALIAALGAVVGVVFTVSGTIYAAKKKVQEIEVVYEQRLQDRYLDNARAYLESVYMPLHLALAKLTGSYRTFRSHIDFDAQEAPSERVDDFRAAAMAYDDTVRELLDRGAGAFLTAALEERLGSFNEFLRESLGATETQVEVLLSVGLSYLGMHMQTERTHILHKRLPYKVRFNYLGWKTEVYEKQLLRAPLATRNFEEAFVRQTTLLRILIKEVTLGTHGRMSQEKVRSD